MRKVLQSNVRDELYADIQAEAKRRGCSVADVVREAVIAHIRKVKAAQEKALKHTRATAPVEVGP